MSDTPELSRRSFVTKASLGAAAVGAIAVAGPLAGRADAAGTSEKVAPVASIPEPVVAHLTDLKSGTVHVYSGTHGVTVVNHELAQQLARAAGH